MIAGGRSTLGLLEYIAALDPCKHTMYIVEGHAQWIREAGRPFLGYRATCNAVLRVGVRVVFFVVEALIACRVGCCCQRAASIVVIS